MKFKNQQLQNDIEKIKSFDAPITMVKSFDDSQEEPMFILDINDNSYFYHIESDMDDDAKCVAVSFLE